MGGIPGTLTSLFGQEMTAESTGSGIALSQAGRDPTLADRIPGRLWCFPRPIGKRARRQGDQVLARGFASDHQLNQSVSWSSGMRWNSAVLCVTRVVL